MSGRQCWPAPERNKGPILEVLERLVAPGDRVLEIGSGTGQHAAYFAAHLPVEVWQASDRDGEHFPSISAWLAEIASAPAPILLDVTAEPWPVDDGGYDLVYCANMIHIAPFEACLGLLRGAGRCLRVGGRLVLYGPFQIDGTHTAPSNARFDESLKARDSRWGVRDLSVVAEQAQLQRLQLCERVAMPANNQAVVFELTR